MSVHSTVVTAALFALLLAAGNAGAAPKPSADDTAKFAAAAAPMKADAVERLYAGRTWLWKKNGAGFFSIDENGRKRFVARTRTGYGKGDWYVTSGGNSACAPVGPPRTIVAAAPSPASCIARRMALFTNGPTLGGQWYVFRNNPVGKNDEARKLVKGDRVSKELSQSQGSRSK